MKITLLATLPSSFQSKILQDVLYNKGIATFVKNESISSVLNIPSFQIEVYVSENDYGNAKEILKEAFPELV